MGMIRSVLPALPLLLPSRVIRGPPLCPMHCREGRIVRLVGAIVYYEPEGKLAITLSDAFVSNCRRLPVSCYEAGLARP